MAENKSPKEVADILHQELVKADSSVITIDDKQLKKMSGRERIRTAFLDELKDAVESIGHIFASGDKVHIVSQDTNHSPIRKTK